MPVANQSDRGGVDAGAKDATDAEAGSPRATVHPDWAMAENSIVRRFEFRNFAKAAQMANLAAWLGERMGHHPDIAFGWGYCEVRYTSHELGGLTENDFLCAARLDAIVG